MKTRPIEGTSWYAVLLFLYAFLTTIFFVLPVHGQFGDLLLGTGTYRHDAVLNAGILEWGYRSIWSSNLHLFDWPPGFPVKGTLAATENLVGWQLFYAPLRAAGAGVVASYNATLLASLVISGIGCAALSERLGASRIGAAAGGVAFAFNPFHIDHMIHLQTMAVCWAPLALLGLDMALDNGSIRGMLLLSGSLIMTVLSGMYFGVFLVLVLPSYAALCWLTGRHVFSMRRTAAVALLCVASGLLLTPILLPYVDYANSYGSYPHSGTEVSLSALSLRSLVQTPVWLTTWRSTVLASSDTGGFASAFPGIATIVLAIAGAVRLKDRPTKRGAVILAALAGLCLLLALGPTLLLRRGEPIGWATGLPLPGKIFLAFTAVRWPMRIYLYSVLCVAVLASFGITRLLAAARGRWRVVLSACILAALLIELRPGAWFVRASTQITEPAKMSDAYSFLGREKNRGGVVELPIRMDSGLTTPFATRYAYGSSGHLRGVIAFHGSMFPPLLDSLRLSSYLLPEPQAMAFMSRNGVTRLVIHRDLMSADSSRTLVNNLRTQGYPIVFNTNNSVVFSLLR